MNLYLICEFAMCDDLGHYPEWDEDHPIHFVGHSAGGQVVRVLQQMLADKVRIHWILYSIATSYPDLTKF